MTAVGDRPRKLRRTDPFLIAPEPPPRYSQKGRDAHAKMLHQTIRAIHDPSGEKAKGSEMVRLPSLRPLRRRATDLSSQPQGAQEDGSRPYNVGDSRVILIKEGKFFQLSEDADLQNRRFTIWHKNQGNTIAKVRGVWRVSRPGTPVLGLARAVGGHPWMCRRPKISFLTVGDGEDSPREGKIFCNHRDVLIFASDGVTAKMTTRGIVEMFNKYRDSGMSYKEIASEIAAQAGASAGSDNSSVLIVPIRAESR